MRSDQIRKKLRVWSHLLKKSLMEKFIFFVQCKNLIKWSNPTQSDKAMHPDKTIHLKAPAAGNGLTKVKYMATFTI